MTLTDSRHVGPKDMPAQALIPTSCSHRAAGYESVCWKMFELYLRLAQLALHGRAHI